VLSSVTPAAAAYAPERVVETTIGPYAVTIEVAPARRGPQSFRVTARGDTEATPPAASIQLDLQQAAGPVQGLPVTFPYRLSGAIEVGRPTGFTFVSSSVNVPGTGAWTGTLTLVASPTRQYTANFTYQVV
jgi:copper transport protein